MSFITACSSAGQACHEGSCGWTRASLPSPSNCTPTSTSPRQPSITPRPLPPATGAISTRDLAGGHADGDLAQQAQRLEDFVEAHRHARGHIAALVGDRAHAERRIGRRRRVALAVGAAIEDHAGGAGRHAGERQFARQGGVDDAGGQEAILQAGVLVVDARAVPSPRGR